MLPNSENYERVSLKEGDVLFRKGDDAEALYLMEHGLIATFDISESNRVIPIFSRQTSGVIGEDCVFQEKPINLYNAVALQSTSLIKIPASEIHLFLSSSSDWLENILFELSQRIRNTSELVMKHNIIHKDLNNDIEFSDEQLKQLRDSLKD